jgi:glycosyltransferase involved in cell wall biosynthesis
MKPSLLIPAFRPTPALVTLSADLLSLGATEIIVVDDGSPAEESFIFEELARLQGVSVLRHAVNLGKGRALKTGLNHFLLTSLPESSGVVTLDADGQHLAADVLMVANALEAAPESLHLGVRKFGRNVPFRSLLGNEVTRLVFGFVTNIWIRDTQTGLRGIPTTLIPELLAVQGERYEFEIGVLLKTKERRVPITEHLIETVYIDDNRGSHFNPVLDSMRIYFVLLRFASSSMLTSLVDFVVFSIFYSATAALGWSLIAGRLVASVVQFTVNRIVVFHSEASVLPALARYYLLVVVLGTTAYFLIDLGRARFGGHVVVLKALVETALFFTSYGLQSAFVFRAGSGSKAGPS